MKKKKIMYKSGTVRPKFVYVDPPPTIGLIYATDQVTDLMQVGTLFLAHLEFANCQLSVVCLHHYRPQRSWGTGYVFTGVCDSDPQEGEYLDQVTPPGIRYTPRTRYTPQDEVHPPRIQVHPLPWIRSISQD